VFGPFSAGSSLRVYRLQRKGASLDLQRDLTQPSSPLWEAWLAYVTQQAMGRPTFVLHDLHDGEGFVQVRYRSHQAAADIAHLAPTLDQGERVGNLWMHLLDGACMEAASQGIVRVFANLPDSGAEVEVFHQAGFTPYAAEDVFRLAEPPSGLPVEKPHALRLQRAEDWPSVQKLCVAVTPQRVRQTEGGIAAAIGRGRNWRRYVLPGKNGEDLIATLGFLSGAMAHWMRVLVHPDAAQLEPAGPLAEGTTAADALIRWGLEKLDDRSGRPIYCNVRQYESGVRGALEALGFEEFATRTLHVKHTVAWSKVPAQELVQALKGGAEPIPPAFRINGEPELQTPNGRLAAEHKARS
jgi:hypothetical protein